jgi:4-oxalocrotonate tautomerase
MPEIFVYMFEGRSLDQKRSLVLELTNGAVKSLGVSAQSVTVQLIESPKAMRSRGGVLFSDVPSVDPVSQALIAPPSISS